MADRRPLNYPRFRAFNGNGVPLEGGTVEFFEAGSTNNRTVYSDPDLTVAAPNPVTLNARGEPESGGGTPIDIYVDGNPYKIVLKDSAGSTIWTIDDYIAGDLPTGTGDDEVPTNSDIDSRGFAQQVDSVSDLQSGSYPASLDRIWLSGYYGVGTAGGGPLYRDPADTTTADNGGTVFIDADGVRWKRPSNSALNILEWGAKGDNAYTNNLEHFKAASDHLNSVGGGSIFIPAGTYLFNEGWAFYDNLTISGEGWNTVLRANQDITDNDGGHGFVSNKDDANLYSNIVIRDLWVDQNGKNVPQDECLSLTNVEGFRYENVKASNSNGYGIYATGTGDGPSNVGVITGCYALNNLYNIEVKGVYDISIIGNHCENGTNTSGGGGIHVRESPDVSERVVISGNTVEGSGGKGIDFLNAAKEVTFADNVVNLSGDDWALQLFGDSAIASEQIVISGGSYKTTKAGQPAVNVSSNVSDVLFTGVSIFGGNSCVQVQGSGSESVSFIGCRIETNPNDTSVQTTGIRENDLGRMLVSACRFIINNNTSITEKWAVYCDGTTYNTVEGCIIEKAADLLLPGGTLNNVARNNRFLDGFYDVGVRWPETLYGTDRFLVDVTAGNGQSFDTGIQIAPDRFTRVIISYGRSSVNRDGMIAGFFTDTNSGQQIVAQDTFDDTSGLSNDGNGFDPNLTSVARIGNAGTLEVTSDFSSDGRLQVEVIR